MFIYTKNTHGLFTVYLIINKTNNKRYIGIHKEKPGEDLYAYMGSGTDITKAIRNEGVDNFTKVILARFDTREEAMTMEKQLVTKDIVESTEYYNRMTGGGHPIFSEASLEKKREAMKGKFAGEKHPMYGKTGEKAPMYGRTGEKNPMYGKTGEKAPMYGRSGKNSPRAKLANIYCYKTDRLIAEGVVIGEWCRENPYNQGALSTTTRADRTLPHCCKTNPHKHKGIYALYIE